MSTRNRNSNTVKSTVVQAVLLWSASVGTVSVHRFSNGRKSALWFWLTGLVGYSNRKCVSIKLTAIWKANNNNNMHNTVRLHEQRLRNGVMIYCTREKNLPGYCTVKKKFALVGLVDRGCYRIQRKWKRMQVKRCCVALILDVGCFGTKQSK